MTNAQSHPRIVRSTDHDGMKVEFWKVTPEVAAHLLTFNSSNRRLGRHTVETYAGAMLRDEWEDHSQIVFNEKGQLVNGQHRLAAVVKSGITVWFVVVTGASMKAFEVEDDFKKRTLAHALEVRGEVNVKDVAAATTLVWRILNNSVRSNDRPTRRQLIALLDEHPQIRDLVRFPGQAELSNLGIGVPRSVSSALHYLFTRVDEVDAKAFFHDLVEGEMLTPGSPILALRRRLLTSTKSQVHRISPTVKAAWIIKTWNLWQEGRDDVTTIRWRVGGAQREDFPSIHGLTEALDDDEPDIDL